VIFISCFNWLDKNVESKKANRTTDKMWERSADRFQQKEVSPGINQRWQNAIYGIS